MNSAKRFGLFLFGVALAMGASAEAAPQYQANEVTATALVPNLPDIYHAVLRKPPANPKTHIAVFVMHAFDVYSNEAVCTQLATRGYITLCADGPFTDKEFSYNGYEDDARAISGGIDYLRKNVPGVTKVVIWGHSMGGPMMAFYQNVQQNGPSACTAPERIVPCDTKNLVDANGQNKLAPADGLILFDSHPGDAVASFTYMDPAIKNPDEPGNRDPALDMFSPANGYPGDAAVGAPNYKGAKYSDAFVQRYFAAQAARNAAVTKQALDLWTRIKQGDKSLYPDDARITVPGAIGLQFGGGGSRLWQADLDLQSCTKNPHIFLSRDGRQDMSPGPICSVRVPSTSLQLANRSANTIQTTARAWLGVRAIRTNGTYTVTKDGTSGIDYDSSNTSTITNVKGITKPLLIVGAGAHYFLSPDEAIYDAAKTTDKTYVISEGAVHGGKECFACEQARGLPRGYYGDFEARIYDYVDQWLARRF